MLCIIQIPVVPDENLVDDDPYHDRSGSCLEVCDEPVYRSCGAGACMASLEHGSAVDYTSEEREQPHITNPMHYLRSGNVRGPGTIRLDYIKVIAVDGDLTDCNIEDASLWLKKMNKDSIPLQEVVM